MIVLNESYLINIKDIYYNKDKFNSGQINLCFITGFSGSGKSTMANNMKDVESYELDDVVENYRFSDKNLKEYGDLIYSYFNTIGKQYRIDSKSSINNIPNFCRNNVISFIKYSFNYAKENKNKKYIINGVQLFSCLSPTELPFDNYAVYIKGTSRFNSSLRATKRNINNDESDGANVSLFNKIKMFNIQMKLQKNELKYFNEWYNYFKKKGDNK